MSEKATNEYKMPAVEEGQVIHWFHDGKAGKDVRPIPGLVVKVGTRSLCVALFKENNYNLELRDGVRHVGDPAAKESEKREAGGWDYTQRDKDLMKLKVQMAEVMNYTPKK
jgi:hypothetical protein